MINRIAILGSGRFGEVMIRTLLSPLRKNREVEIVASHRRADRRAELEKRYGITVFGDNREACNGADVIYPIVRPDQMSDLMEEIGPLIRDDQILTPGAAALPLSFYRQWVKSECTLAWVFPTPFMSVNRGFLAICPEDEADSKRIDELKDYWSGFCEEIIIINRSAMDTFVLLHAAGQTFFWPVIKAYIEFGSSHGFSRDQASAITLSTLESTAKWLRNRGADPFNLEELMEEFSVSNSLTKAGLDVLKKGSVESLYGNVMKAGLEQAHYNREQ